MKKHLLALLLIGSWFCGRAQWVSIPDTNFGTWLSMAFPLCAQGNNTIGWQMNITCPDVVNATTVNCTFQNINNLTGIQYFINLQNFSCAGNPLGTLPALPNSITTLSCNFCQLTSISSLPSSLTDLLCSFNQLTTLPPLPNGLTSLGCYSNQLISLPTLPNSLTTFFCYNNQLTSLPALPNSLPALLCYNNQLTSLPTLPSSLTTVDCSGNLLTSLPALPNSLTYLDCYSNHLSSLPSLPNSLTTLNCYYNQLTSLPALPNSLTTLDCNTNQLIILPSLPNGLTTLICHSNQLTSLPTLPNSLPALICYSNQLTGLPALPNSLTSLDCANNLIDSLPYLPNSITSLNCSVNMLGGLPILPSSLSSLNCASNFIDTLSTLPNLLRGLNISHNQLISLPVLPDSLRTLQVEYNQLISVPTLPSLLSYVSLASNPLLSCLPILNNAIENLFLNETGITCLPNVPNNPNFTYLSDSVSLPICDLFNSHGCTVYSNIKGRVYVDTSMNCQYEPGEDTYRNLPIKLYQNGVLEQQAYTITGGEYSFITNLNTYQFTIDTINLPFNLACPDSGYYTSTITLLDSFYTNMNFGLHCKPSFDLIAQSINGRFRPGNTRQVDISVGDATNFYGARCAAGTSGSVQLIINGSAHYDSPATGALAPTTVSSDTIIWNIADFGAVNFFSDFNINVATDTNAVLGSQICFTLVVNPIAGDNNPANNVLHHCGTVVSSYDPNGKEVYPAVNIDTATKWLAYTIHFQNTGTTEAQHICVTDTLDSNIDPASFQLLAYSHQPMVQIKENAVRFNFPNINLPDSNTNEPLSHGYVQYKVKLKENLPVGTNISNTAFIYFDFNAPVVTNTTTNTIALATGIADNRQRLTDNGAIHLQPNPASSFVNISVDESMIGSNLTVYDVTGRKMAAIQLKTLNFKLETSSFANGVYFVTVENERGRVTKKLVIE